MLLSHRWQCGGAVLLAIMIGLTLQESRQSSDHSQQQQQQRSRQQQRGERGKESSVNNGRPPRQAAVKISGRTTSDKPNIVFIITDDQDVELGSLNFMPKTARAIRDQGATFVNAFCTTPMCCPSRSSMLTGMYVHNHNVYTNNDNCSSEQWRQNHEIHNFGTYLSNAGYRTGFFGKYLNEYTGAYIPPGWTEWLGLIRNTRFYNYTLNYNGQKVKHEDNYEKDYLTDVIANDSVRFLQESKRHHPNKPVAMVLSMPAPHGPEDAAPQYQHLFMDVKSHRTPSWNFAPNPDKQWLLQYTGKMTPLQIAFTDILHTKRLQTLQSVDDAVDKVVRALEDLDELDNTYIIYTSDHGYHLGQYGLVKGKAMPYDFDIRVPFYIRGPKINPGIRVSSIALILDIAPTLLDIAGVPAPDHMDGSSVLKLFDAQPDSQSSLRRRRAWRDTFLVERGKLTQRKLKVQEKLEAHFNRLVTTKEQRLEEECQKAEYQPPCRPGQQLECRRNEHGKLRIYKCRFDNVTSVAHTSQQTKCNCLKQRGSSSLDKEMDAEEIQRQLDFLQHHVNQPKMVEPRFISERIRRDTRKLQKNRRGTTTVYPRSPEFDSGNITAASFRVERRQKDEVTNDNNARQTADSHWLPVHSKDNTEIPCRLNVNGTVVCERYVYSNVHEWTKQKAAIEGVLTNYRHRVSVLESIQKHLNENEPTTKPRERYTSSTVSPATETPMVATTTVGLDYSTSGHVFNATNDDQEMHSVISDETEIEDDETEDEDSVIREENSSSFVDDSLCTCDDENEDGMSSPRSRTYKHKLASTKLELLARDVASQEERDNHRRQKMEQHRLSKVHSAVGRRQRKYKSKKHRTQSPFDCSLPNVSCPDGFTSSPTTSGPVKSPNSPWHGVDFSHFSSRRDPMCHIDGLECTRMDDEHWKTAPFWTHGPFCLCPNSNNNTYWCLRTVNETHNFLYCEFITGFISFYDMTRDPYQLRNAVHDLSFAILHQLHDTLEIMKGCKGSRKCNPRSKLGNADLDEPRENVKHVRHSHVGKVTKINDHHADTARSKWL